MDIYQLIRSISLLAQEFDDEIIWTPSENGRFSPRTIASSALMSELDVSWATLVWFKGMIPKNSTCFWMALMKSLKTKDLLLQRNIGCDPRWPLCYNFQENNHHLFIECQYSSNIWAVICSKFSISHRQGSSLQGHVEAFIEDCRGNNNGEVMLPNEVVLFLCLVDMEREEL